MAAPGTVYPYANALAVRVRRPGQDWGAPRAVPLDEGWAVPHISVALSGGGALIAWSEVTISEADETVRLRVVRRSAEAELGAPETVATGKYDFTFSAGASTRGNAIVLWRSYSRPSSLPASEEYAAIALASAPFGPT